MMKRAMGYFCCCVLVDVTRSKEIEEESADFFGEASDHNGCDYGYSFEWDIQADTMIF